MRLRFLFVALAVVACASPSKLAQQSTRALNKGDLRTAYDRALRAVEKDPQNQAARNAYTAASRRMDADYRARVTALAVADTIAAADLALEARGFRTEVARHETALDPAPDYARAEQAILSGAARRHYQRGVDAMASQRPRLAVDEFTAVQRYDRGFADLAQRIADARRAATVRVAVLPFIDDVNVPGLALEIGDTVQHELARRVPGDLRYTVVIGADEVDRSISVAEMRGMRRDNAPEFGRRVGADLVVVGRLRGLHSNSSQKSGQFQLFRRIEDKDNRGNTTMVRWDPSTISLVTRDRTVTAQMEFDIVDTRTGGSVAHEERSENAFARTVWTDYRPDDHYDQYALLPPDVRKSDPERAKKIDDDWRKLMGSWELADLLRHAR
ncbi:MAG TPA: hypothetical protein VE967_20000, partial [Gemmatimonadaceae bacterium]|nr:hypothetical protein [Gemmatimonadaceae bacterium]